MPTRSSTSATSAAQTERLPSAFLSPPRWSESIARRLRTRSLRRGSKCPTWEANRHLRHRHRGAPKRRDDRINLRLPSNWPLTETGSL